MNSIIEALEKIVKNNAALSNSLFFITLLAITIPDITRKTIIFVGKFFPDLLTNYLNNLDIELYECVNAWVFIVILFNIALIYDILIQVVPGIRRTDFGHIITFIYNINIVCLFSFTIYASCFKKISLFMPNILASYSTFTLGLFYNGIGFLVAYIFFIYFFPVIEEVYSNISSTNLNYKTKLTIYLFLTLLIIKIFVNIGTQII